MKLEYLKPILQSSSSLLPSYCTYLVFFCDITRLKKTMVANVFLPSIDRCCKLHHGSCGSLIYKMKNLS